MREMRGRSFSVSWSDKKNITSSPCSGLSPVHNLFHFPKSASLCRVELTSLRSRQGTSFLRRLDLHYVDRLWTAEKGLQYMQSPKGSRVSRTILNAVYTDICQIRCSGERPVCKRCMRLKHNCIYSTPNVRDPKTHRASFAVSDEPIQAAFQEHARNISQDFEPTVNHHAASPVLLAQPTLEDRHLGIPKSLLSTLVEVYFDNVYNAQLLLHKRSFVQSVAAGTARPHVVFGVCAFAAKYAFRDSFYQRSG